MKVVAVLSCLLVALSACGRAETAGPPERESPIAIGDLTETYGCGTGFWIGNPEQTVALRLEYRGDEGPAPRVKLPDPEWNARVIAGENLYANWCDDVMEPHEPSPVEAASYEITAGILEIDGAIPQPFESGSLTLHATGLVMTGSDSTTVQLGDVTITNEMYGFFAG